MPFNGTGGFDPLPPPTYPAVAGDTIRAAYFNAVIDDIRAGLSGVLVRDGQAPMAGNINLAGNKITNAGTATNAGDYISLGQAGNTYIGKGVGLWQTSADVPTPRERFFFTDDDATIIRGHGDPCLVFRNSANSTIGQWANSGELIGSADAISPSAFVRLGQLAGYGQRSLTAAQASTSGTSILFGGIPSWAKQITVNFDLVSTNGSDQVQVQLGTSGGLEIASYQGSSMFINSLNFNVFNIGGGISMPLTGAAATRSGSIVLRLVAGNVWTFVGNLGNTAGADYAMVAGRKALAGTLTQLSITTILGADTFDGGQISLLIEG